jgi:hypothetical protein
VTKMTTDERGAERRPVPKRVTISIVGLVLAAELGCVALGLSPADYNPKIDPANFRTTVDNPYLPLVPGTTYKFIETVLGEKSVNEITVTHETKVIMGVPCMVVHDVVTKNGILAEDTYDWIAADNHGTVWYFGEDTQEISPGGAISTIGSWEAGVGGAQPGILMPANPMPSGPYRQEYGLGVAEDMGQIDGLGDSVTVPAGTFADCVRTLEWSLLEPGTEKKWYAKGVGVVRTESTAGEVAVLVSITRE